MRFKEFLAKVNCITIDYPRAIEAYAKDDRALTKALHIVPYLYFFLLYQAFSVFAAWQKKPLFSAEQFNPRWTVEWLSLFSFEHAVLLVTGLFLVGMLGASFFFSRRSARIVAFLSLFIFHGFMSSFGGPDHNWLVWIYPLLFLIFLPDLWRKKETTLLERKKFLIGFLGVQIYIGVIYTLAGLGKVVRGLEQMIAGQANFLSPDALALHVANWLPTIGSESVFGTFIVEYPIVGWPLFWGMLYFQLFTLWAIFKPNLHRVWGACLVLFYILNFLIMNILYIDTFFLIAALLLNSPFEKPGTTWKERLRDMPIVGWIFVWYELKREKNARACV